MKCPRCQFDIPDPKRRTTRANRYWYGVVVKAYQEIWSKKFRYPLGLPAYTKDEVHSTLVRVHVGEVEGPLGHKEPAPTKIMDSPVFWKLVNDARHDAYHEYNRYIPEPNEPWIDEFGEPISA